MSDVPLPHLIPNTASCDAPDVTIRRGSVPEALEGATQFGPTWQIADKTLLLRIPDVASFLLQDGKEIVFEPERGVEVEDTVVFLTGTVFGILLHQRNQIVLHASAVRVGDKAVLFCGPSGAGKSTLAAALEQRGYCLLNDDVCAVTVDAHGVPIAHSDGRRFRLWDQAIERLDLGARRGEAVRSKLGKFYVTPQHACVEPLPLGAVYGLREERGTLVEGIERPNLVDATILIRSNAYRQLMVKAMQQREVYFQSAVNIANHAGIFHLTRRLAFKGIPKTIDALERHWGELGLS